jgi:protein phosphatase 1 regulatory subunit 7
MMRSFPLYTTHSPLYSVYSTVLNKTLSPSVLTFTLPSSSPTNSIHKNYSYRPLTLPQSMEGLESLSGMESLWLGKNKIEEIGYVSHMKSLRQLDVQNNRLKRIGIDLTELTNLKELYLACNAIENVEGLPAGSPLSTVDLSSNPLTSLAGIDAHKKLEELWLTSTALASYTDLDPLRSLPVLTCVYLEHSPVAKLSGYREMMLQIVPTLEQLDAIVLSDEK